VNFEKKNEVGATSESQVKWIAIVCIRTGMGRGQEKRDDDIWPQLSRFFIPCTFFDEL